MNKDELMARLENPTDCDFSGENFDGFNLSGLNLCGKTFKGASFIGTKLNCADLNGSDFTLANFEGADLSHASIYNTNFKNAYFKDADLLVRSESIFGSNFNSANLSDVKRINRVLAACLLVCPSEGEFIGWKKVLDENEINAYIVKLRIPADAKRSSATTRKCRASYVITESIEQVKIDLDENIIFNKDKPVFVDKILNKAYCKTVYEINKPTYPDDWDENRWNECSNGIHFFITREEAEAY